MELKVGNLTIGIFTELPQEYSEAIRGATNLSQLREVCDYYFPFAWDAVEAVKGLEASDWKEWIRFKKVSQEDGYAGDDLPQLMEKYGSIILPDPMLRVGMVQAHFDVMWGLACIRLHEIGRLEILPDGRVVVNVGAE